MGDDGGRSGAKADDQRVVRIEAADIAARDWDRAGFAACAGDVRAPRTPSLVDGRPGKLMK